MQLSVALSYASVIVRVCTGGVTGGGAMPPGDPVDGSTAMLLIVVSLLAPVTIFVPVR
ncbi:MAG: hypothetical protein AB7T06_35635 [Kofleriaceae bacterium]